MTTVRLGLRRLGYVIPLAVFVAAGFAIFAAPPTFLTQRDITTTGSLPFDVRTEDMDQDGDLDVYSAGYGGKVAWYENDGGDPPGPWVEHIIGGGEGPQAVFAVRVDGDADIDVFSVDFNLDEVAWHRNDGDAQTWSRVSISFMCRNCEDVWAADLDADGDNDAISLAGFDGRVDWYENTGVSWVVRPIAIAIAEGVEAADLDQDGDLDVVSGLSWYESDGGSPPTFQTRSLPSFPGQLVNRIAVLDVDRDGDPDIVTAGAAQDRLAWFENDGALPPRWTQHVVSTTVATPTSVYAADLDGDADVDVLSSSSSDNTIAWHENDGGSPPSWTKRAISTTAFGARSVFAADLEEDGDVDVVSASQWNGTVAWHVNDADYADADHDGMRDELDCASGDGTAFVVPREVSGARFRSATLLEWNSAVAGSGTGARYDVVRGMLSQLPPGAGSGETCLANDASARSLPDAVVPAPGTGFYYLVRASNACGIGSFGAGSSGVPHNTGACP
jgi:hypothetical protein